MALPTIVVTNATASPVPLVKLGVVVPASSSLTISDFNFPFEIFSDDQLTGLLQSGSMSMTVDGTDLNPNQVNSVMGIVSGPSLRTSISVYDSAGAQSFTNTATTINLDTTLYASNPSSFNVANDTVTVTESGIYMVFGEVSLFANGNQRTQARSWVEVDASEMSGSRSEMYLRSNDYGATGSVSQIVSVSGGESFRLRALRTVGNAPIRTVPNGSRLTFLRLM